MPAPTSLAAGVERFECFTVGKNCDEYFKEQRHDEERLRKHLEGESSSTGSGGHSEGAALAATYTDKDFLTTRRAGCEGDISGVM